ncbi:DUF416 family protein [Mucilaginibacter sp.]|uniref:DUF416 family protein n=1 Tax=Mucilaginibacter sp. TaxID=1882438 RepID=UPI003D100B1E
MNDFLNRIKEKTQNLSLEHLILFCNLNCEKMLEGYLLFSEKEEWGDITFFQDTIKEIYEQLIKKNKQLDYIKTREKLLVNSPDLEEFNSVIASYAFDTCCTFDELIQFLITLDKEHVLNNSQYCINTVDMFVQQKEGITYVELNKIQDLESIIEQDLFMQKEKNRQLLLLNEISKIDIINMEVLESLKNLNASFDSLVDYDMLF